MAEVDRDHVREVLKELRHRVWFSIAGIFLSIAVLLYPMIVVTDNFPFGDFKVIIMGLVIFFPILLFETRGLILTSLRRKNSLVSLADLPEQKLFLTQLYKEPGNANLYILTDRAYSPSFRLFVSIPPLHCNKKHFLDQGEVTVFCRQTLTCQNFPHQKQGRFDNRIPLAITNSGKVRIGFAMPNQAPNALYEGFMRKQWFHSYVIVCLIPFYFLIFPVFFSANMVRWRLANESLTWKPVAAVVRKVNDNVSSDLSMRWFRPYTISYRYEVEGKFYFGKLISYADSNGLTAEEVSRLLANYPEGQNVTAYYRPDNPRYAVLQPGGGESVLRQWKEDIMELFSMLLYLYVATLIIIAISCLIRSRKLKKIQQQIIERLANEKLLPDHELTELKRDNANE